MAKKQNLTDIEKVVLFNFLDKFPLNRTVDAIIKSLFTKKDDVRCNNGFGFADIDTDLQEWILRQAIKSSNEAVCDKEIELESKFEERFEKIDNTYQKYLSDLRALFDKIESGEDVKNSYLFKTLKREMDDL